MSLEFVMKYKNMINNLHSQMAINKHNVERVIEQKNLEITSLKKELYEKNLIIEYTNKLLINKNNTIEFLENELALVKQKLDKYSKYPVSRCVEFDADGNIFKDIKTFTIVDE